MSIKANYPDIRPTLNLDFANTKRLDPRITFTRTTTGTYVGSDGLIKTAAIDEARFDHDPATGESLGLLIEEARTNLIPYSENFDQAAWFKNNLTVSANSATAPDGTSNADKIISDSELSGYIFEGVSITSGNDYTHTVFAKSGEFTSLRVLGQANAFGGNIYADFDLSAGTVGSVIGGSGTASIEDFGSGWYRCVLTLAATATVTSGFQIRPVGTGDGSSGVYVFGAQLEEASFPTSYIPTSGSTVTRSVDVASIATSAFGFNEDEGTVFAKGRTSSSLISALFTINDNSINNRISQRLTGSNVQALIVDGGTTQANINVSNHIIGSFSKSALAYQENNFNNASQGTLGTADTSGTVASSLTQIELGTSRSPSNMLNGHIKKLQYFPRRLSDTVLQGITS